MLTCAMFTVHVVVVSRVLFLLMFMRESHDISPTHTKRPQNIDTQCPQHHVVEEVCGWWGGGGGRRFRMDTIIMVVRTTDCMIERDGGGR